MHVTKSHALGYHAWYNYPQISSQDYESTSCYKQLFFYPKLRAFAIWGKTYLLILVLITVFLSLRAMRSNPKFILFCVHFFLFSCEEKEKETEPKKEKTREQNAKASGLSWIIGSSQKRGFAH